MLLIWRKPKTINDLRSAQVSRPGLNSRKSVRIGVIDDQPFLEEQTLRQLGYDVTFLGNSSSLLQIADFQIVLCDLRGVFTESSLQGAALIKHIRTSFPQIYVIAYSGAHPSSSLHRNASETADAMIAKMADVDEWSDLLDGYVAKCLQPSEYWQRFRLYLIERGIDAVQLMKLEDAFVRAVQKRNRSIFERAAGEVELPESAKPLIEGVASHLIGHALISAI
jgi:hypothetical protein